MEEPVELPERAPTPLCPHCRQPLESVGWLTNAQAGMLTFYHAEPNCMVALNIQMIAAQQERRVQLR